MWMVASQEPLEQNRSRGCRGTVDASLTRVTHKLGLPTAVMSVLCFQSYQSVTVPVFISGWIQLCTLARRAGTGQERIHFPFPSWCTFDCAQAWPVGCVLLCVGGGGSLSGNRGFFHIAAPGAGMVQKNARPNDSISLPTCYHLVPSSLIEVVILGNVDCKWFLL